MMDVDEDRAWGRRILMLLVGFALWFAIVLSMVGCGAGQKIKTTTEAQISCVENAFVSLLAKLAVGESKGQIAIELTVEEAQCALAALSVVKVVPPDAGVPADGGPPGG